MADGHRWFLGRKAEQGENGAAFLVELDLGGADLDALAHRFVATRLRVGFHFPQPRAGDGVGDHEAQRDLGMAGQCGAGGGVARSGERPAELQAIMRTSYAVCCLKNKTEPPYIKTL